MSNHHKRTLNLAMLLLCIAFTAVAASAADPGITPPLDLSITKAGPASIVAGSNVGYVITVTTNSVMGGAISANVIDTLPNGWTFLSTNTSQGSCTGVGTGTANCNIGTMTSAMTVTIEVLVHVPVVCQPNIATNTATVSGAGDPDTNNNTATVVSSVVQTNLGAGSCIPPSSGISSTKPGSILLFPFYSSSASNSNDANTRIAMTNTHPTRGVAVHLFFVDGSSCSVADSFVCLTPNQTVAFLMSDIDPGVSGYVIAVASDGPGGFGEGLNTGCPISFNYLIGHESFKLPVSSSGGIGNAVLARTKNEGELEAESVAAEFGSPVPGCDPSTPNAVLRFNGQPNGYNPLPRVLAASNIPSRADGNSTYLVINRIGGDLTNAAATIGSLFGILYDDAESAYSFSLSGSCQLRGTLSGNFPRTVPRFDTIIPAGRSGWMKFWGASDIGIIGAQINNNVNIGSAVNAFDGGHLLHKLTFTTSAVLTVPVFPPSC